MKTIYKEAYRKSIALLKEKRIEKGVTQSQLAEKLGISQAVISKIETCERRLDIIELREICNVIGQPFTELTKEISNI